MLLPIPLSLRAAPTPRHRSPSRTTLLHSRPNLHQETPYTWYPETTLIPHTAAMGNNVNTSDLQKLFDSFAKDINAKLDTLKE